MSIRAVTASRDVHNCPEDLARMLRAKIAKWAKVANSASLK
jgi:hypothetical protein